MQKHERSLHGDSRWPVRSARVVYPPMERAIIPAILFGVLLLSCNSASTAMPCEIKKHEDTGTSGKYRAMIGNLPVIEKNSYKNGSNASQYIYKSPLTAKLGINIESGQNLLALTVDNPNNFSWFYPNHVYYSSLNFRITDSNGNEIDSGPTFNSPGRIKLSDDMFREISAHSKDGSGYVIPIEKLVSSGQKNFCAQFTNSQVPPSVAEYFSAEKNMLVSVVLRSNKLCFDLVEKSGEVILGNIRPANE